MAIPFNGRFIAVGVVYHEEQWYEMGCHSTSTRLSSTELFLFDTGVRVLAKIELLCI